MKAYGWEFFKQVQFFGVFVFESMDYLPRFFGYGSSFGHYGQYVFDKADKVKKNVEHVGVFKFLAGKA